MGSGLFRLLFGQPGAEGLSVIRDATRFEGVAHLSSPAARIGVAHRIPVTICRSFRLIWHLHRLSPTATIDGDGQIGRQAAYPAVGDASSP